MKKVAIYALAGSLILILCGFIYQTASARADRQQHPAPGAFYRVNGLSIHMDCRGQGSPTVILEAGLTTGSLSWALVHDDLARQTRTCAYDRPGIDWSEPVSHPQGAPEIAAQLHALLETSDIEDPLVLVGMSAGGVYVREYFTTYPQDVVGMIFVDSAHEQQGNRLTSEAEGGTAEIIEGFFSLCGWMQPLGLVRLTGLMNEILDNVYGLLPESDTLAARANANQSHSCTAQLQEWRAFEGEIHDTNPPADLDDLPLIVLSQGKPPQADDAFGVTLEQAQLERAEWNVLQEELASLSSNSEHRIALESGHGIQFEQPQIVVSAVKDMLARVNINSK